MALNDKDDFFKAIRADVKARLDELEPAVLEYERLRKLLHAIDAEDSTLSLGVHGSGRARVSKTDGKTGGKTDGRRAEPRGRRAREVLALIRNEPGLQLTQIAERLGMRPGYLYELLPTLSERGFVRERDQGWHPT